MMEETQVQQEPEQTETPEVPQEQPEQPEQPDPGLTVTIDEEAPQEEAPGWVRNLRKQNRELQKRVKELEVAQPVPDIAPLKKPTLAELDYDSEKYENALEAWYRRRDEIERIAAQRRAEEESQAAEWQKKLNNYHQSRSTLRVANYEDAEAAVQNTLSVTQQGVLIAGCQNPALVVYALGQNPQKAQEIAAITDPVKFAFAIANLERDLKINRKTPPPPMKIATGTGPVSGAMDSTLDRLRAEAEKTNDYSKVFQYRRQARQRS